LPGRGRQHRQAEQEGGRRHEGGTAALRNHPGCNPSQDTESSTTLAKGWPPIAPAGGERRSALTAMERPG